MVNQKCERWAQALVDQLKANLAATYNVTKAYEAVTNDIYVSVALAAGGNNSVKALIKLKPATAPANGAYDSLGLAATVFTPHIAQVIFDITTPFSAGTTELERALVLAKVLPLGTRVEFYSKAVGAGNLAIGDFVVGNFIGAYNNVEGSFGAMANL